MATSDLSQSPTHNREEAPNSQTGLESEYELYDPDGNDSFALLDRLLDIGETMNTTEALRLYEHFCPVEKRKQGLINGKNPGLHVINFLRSERIISPKDISKLESAAKELQLTYLTRKIDQHKTVSNLPVFPIKTTNSGQHSLLENNPSSFKRKRDLSRFFRNKYNAQLLGCQKGCIELRLAVPSIDSLERLREDVQSGALAEELKSTFGFNESLITSYEQEVYDDIHQQLTLHGDGSFALLLRDLANFVSIEDVQTLCHLFGLSQSEREEITSTDNFAFSLFEMLYTKQLINGTNVELMKENLRSAELPKAVECVRKYQLGDESFALLLRDLANIVSIEDVQTLCHLFGLSQSEREEITSTDNFAFSLFEMLYTKQLINGTNVELMKENLRSAELPEAVECVRKYQLGDKSFPLLLRDLANIVSIEDVETLCHLLGLSQSEREEITSSDDSTFSLFEMLYAKQLINGTNVELLKENLRLAELPEAVERVRKYQLDTDKRLAEWKTILQEVGLDDYFPCKLSKNKATEVRILHEKKPTNLPFIFINRLTSLDSRVVLPETLKLECSVRDFIFALFHCSDIQLRRHLVEKIAMCRLAVTVLLPGGDEGNKPLFLLYALRDVVKKWKESADSLSPEKYVVKEKMFTVAFIRIGDVRMSKSLIINNILGRVQGHEYFRFFLSSKEDEEPSFVSEGTLEAQWYLPMHENTEETFTKVTLILNLRGNATSFPAQTQFACKAANAVIVLVDVNRDKTSESTLKEIQGNAQEVFVVEAMEEKISKKRMDRGSRRRQHNELVLEAEGNCLKYQVENGENLRLSRFLAHKILEACSKTSIKSYRCIESWTQFCGTLIDIDENNNKHRKSLKLFQNAFPPQNELNIEKIKREYLPLQVEWLKWVEVDRTRFKGDTVIKQIEEKRSEKKAIRSTQQKNGLSQQMNLFKESFITASKDQQLIHYFMAHFQHYIERMFAEEITPLISEFDNLNNELAAKKREKKSLDVEAQSEGLISEISVMESKLLQISNDCSNRFLCCEHFFREIGHLYEAKFDGVDNHIERKDEGKTAAARLLLEGYPLEILDGESGYIPIKWIEGVLNELKNILHDPKIFVLSIIGVQSSGKSTLLNCMFGVRFPVRAGRCTRGLFMQAIKICPSFQETIGFDYLLVIDTEGLQATDRVVKNDFVFDNSIATLSMCIGDITLLNIGQETIGTDMVGILQIAVHALLRMKKVKLVSHCRIIQQKVTDIAAAEKNKTNMEKIKSALDKATKTAALDEHCAYDIQEFSDIFPLIQQDDLQFFPSLWIGLMSPPNPLYSEKVQKLKEHVLFPKKEEHKVKPQFTLERFIFRLKDVWNAIKEENFVFNFQNSFDALCYKKFRLHYNRVIGKMRTNMVGWELKHIDDRLTEENVQGIESELEEELQNQYQSVIEAIDEYVKDRSDEQEVRRRESDFKNETEGVRSEIKLSLQNKIFSTLRTREQLEYLPTFLRNAKTELRKAAKRKAQELRQENPKSKWTVEALSKVFEELWEKKQAEIILKYSKTQLHDKDIEQHCERTLRALFEGAPMKTFLEILNTRRQNQLVSPASDDRLKKGSWGVVQWTKDIWHNIRGRHKENEEQLNHYIDSKIRDEIEGFEMQVRNKPFSKIVVKATLYNIFNKVSNFDVNEEMLVEVCLNACSDIIKISQENHKRFEQENSLHSLFLAEKTKLEDDFKAYFDDTVQTKRAVERSYDDLVSAFADIILIELNVELLHQMRKKNCFIDKQIMVGTILTELCEQNNAQQYKKFIQSHKMFIKNWLEKKVIEFLQTKNSEKELLLQVNVQNKVKQLIKSLVSILSRVEDKIEEAKNPKDQAVPNQEQELNVQDESKKERQITFAEGETVFRQEKIEEAKKPKDQVVPNQEQELNVKDESKKEWQISLAEWETVFRQECNSSNLDIPKTEIFSSDFPSINYIIFTDEMKSCIMKQMEESVLRSLCLYGKSESQNLHAFNRRLKTPLHLELLKNLKGCYSVCPFCKVNCNLQGIHDKHKAIMHYPQGVAEVAWYNSDILVLDTCTMFVASECSFMSSKLKEWVKHRDYRKVYPEWDINPITDDKPIDYWKWVLANHNEFFAQQRDKTPAQIPASWLGITKQQAKDNIKEFFNLNEEDEKEE